MCIVALNGFTATAAGPASPVLNGHTTFSQSHNVPAVYGTSAFFQLASPSATFPAVRIDALVRSLLVRCVVNWVCSDDTETLLIGRRLGGRPVYNGKLLVIPGGGRSVPIMW